MREGETIWTESSHKYKPAEVSGMAADTGFRCEGQWIDAGGLYQNWLIAEIDCRSPLQRRIENHAETTCRKLGAN